MFEKLVIKNFQKHGLLEIPLDEKVTSIVGPSDTGKSAVIRSLRWLCQNSPSGIEFLKEGTASVSVSLNVDGKEIKRDKSPTNNAYYLDGTSLRAFGQGVPDAVAAVLDIDDINFQDQLDPPYWLTLSSGEVSRQLNALIDLSIIDETMKNINRIRSRSVIELELAEDKAKKKEQQQDEMQWVPECEMDFSVVQAAGTFHEEKRIDLEDLKILDKGILSASIDADRARSKLSAVVEVGKVSAYARKQRQVLDGVAGVLSAVEALQVTLQFRTVSTEAVDSASFTLLKHKLSLQSLLKIRDDYRVSSPLVKNKNVTEALKVVGASRLAVLTQKESWLALEKLVGEIENKDDEIHKHQLALIEAQKEIEEKTKGQICPVCGKFGL